MAADSESTLSGLEAVGALSWGSHFCQFYETGEDLRGTLVPYFKAGLDNDEQCIWVTADPFTEEDARAALRARMPGFDALEARGQVEIIDHRRWYERGGRFEPSRTIEAWLAREAVALDSGYRGLRISGNTSWVDEGHWKDFADYEGCIHESFHGHQIVALCSYHLARCQGAEVLDVVRNHEFALARRHGAWEVVESAAPALARKFLRRANAKPERGISERTARLERASEEKRAGDGRFREILEVLPAAVYTTDAAGRVTFYNKAAAELAGRTPELGSDKWCVTWRLYRPDGTPLPHDECPMALALKENRPIRGVEAVAERPDGARIPILPYPSPLRDASGRLVGAVNMLVDISERKVSENQYSKLLSELNHRVKNNLQMLHSLLRMAERETESQEAKAVLADASNRIGTMGAAQAVLYGAASPSSFEAHRFIEAICRSVERTFGSKVSIVREAASGELSNDTIMPLALILNELLTNAAKHAADSEGVAHIKVGLTNGADRHVLYVQDDGPGFQLNEVRKRSSGLGLVSGLVRQLGGAFSVERDRGARCSVEFRSGS